MNRKQRRKAKAGQIGVICPESLVDWARASQEEFAAVHAELAEAMRAEPEDCKVVKFVGKRGDQAVYGMAVLDRAALHGVTRWVSLYLTQAELDEAYNQMLTDGLKPAPTPRLKW